MNQGQDILSNSVLKQYINSSGRVDYTELFYESWLNQQIQRVEEMDIESLNHDEEKAFWLNAYNIMTLKSVRIELEANNEWEGVKSIFAKIKFFLLRRHRIANRKMSLYTLENKIIRGKFKDPRVHFAINCASSSCPILPERLFDAETLDDYLETLTHSFINEQDGVIIKGDELHLSRIFKWYRRDFGDEQELLDFIRTYWEGDPIPPEPTIKYMDYDWSLNSDK